MTELQQESFQERVKTWTVTAFGQQAATSRRERQHRLCEEVLELLQSAGYSQEDVQKMLQHVYSRPPGELRQELGGVCVTLAAFCTAYDVDQQVVAEAELSRTIANIDKIRAKHATKVHREVFA